MLESEEKWQAQLQDRLDATIEEHLEAKRHLVARATRAEEAVSSYSKARRRYTILDLLLESTEDAAARLDANAKELEKFLVDLDVPVGALRILRDLGARSVSDLAFVEASDFDAAVDLTDVQKRRLIDAIDETKKRLAKKRASTNEPLLAVVLYLQSRCASNLSSVLLPAAQNGRRCYGLFGLDASALDNRRDELVVLDALLRRDQMEQLQEFFEPDVLGLAGALGPDHVDHRRDVVDGVEVHEGHGRRTMSIMGTGKVFFEMTPLVSLQNLAKIVFVMCSSR